MKQFKHNKITALFTTDVAARGLDIKGYLYDVNAEVPLYRRSYLHRSGRTGRMGSEGIVITFVQDHTLRDLKKIARKADLSIKEIFSWRSIVRGIARKEEMNRENEPHKKLPTIL